MKSPPVTTALADLRARTADLMLRDERRLGRRLDGVRKVREPGRRAAVLDQIAAEITAAEQRLERRRATVPTPSYPPELPVSTRRDDLAAAIRDHQVVIVAGE